MGINDNTKGMIDSLAKGDLERTKAYAKCILANDHSEKNKKWCNRMMILLDSGSPDRLELPSNLYSLCELVRPGADFQPDMYYLPAAEATVVNEIMRKQKIVRRMQMHGVPVANTALLYGEPGTGKTELVKYIAYKLNKPLLIMRFSNLIDSHMGETGKNIAKVFDFFNQNDIILFLDEIDTIAIRRDGGTGCDGEIARTTACIMQELDRLSGGGIIIAATNRRDLLDPALLRRFSIQHEVARVGKDERQRIIAAFWQALSIQPPFNVAEYAGNDYTPSRIHTDMVKKFASYLEMHPEDTQMEADVKKNIIIPMHWAQTFLLAADKLQMPDSPCAEMEKDSFRIAQIAADLPIPEEAKVIYDSDTAIDYYKRADAVRYSIYLCRTAYQQYYHTDKRLSMTELAKWVSEYIDKSEKSNGNFKKMHPES